jgi:hypothetical protein
MRGTLGLMALLFTILLALVAHVTSPGFAMHTLPAVPEPPPVTKYVLRTPSAASRIAACDAWQARTHAVYNGPMVAPGHAPADPCTALEQAGRLPRVWINGAPSPPINQIPPGGAVPPTPAVAGAR